MGVKIVIAASAVYALLGVCVSFYLWDTFPEGKAPALEIIRNLVLIGSAPLAIFLAVWRSSIAQKQAEIAQGGLLSNRHQRAVEMLGHDFVSIRIGGIYALRDIALEHPDEYKRAVGQLLLAYAHEPKTDSDMDPAAKWELEAVRREALFVLEILKIPSLEEQALARLRKKKVAEQA